MNDIYKIERNDVEKVIYFIIKLVQKNGGITFRDLTGKDDYIGGTLDRFLNTISERAVFDKIVLPKVNKNKNVESIRDYFLYTPGSKNAGIAPDVIGIKIDEKIIPFAYFEDKWKPHNGKPQIEVKTFKKTGYMVSLRNQGYKDFLIMAESDFRPDYLVPFIDNNVLSENVFNSMVMDENKFIVTDSNKEISNITPVINTDNSIGTIRLLNIMKVESFKKYSTKCEEHVSVKYYKTDIDEFDKAIRKPLNIPLKDLCDKTELNLFRFGEKFYSGIEDGIPYIETKRKNKTSTKEKVRMLDFWVEDIDSIMVLNKTKDALIIESSIDNHFGIKEMKKNVSYIIQFSTLSRPNGGEEYFMQKDLIQRVPNCEIELINMLNDIIEKEK